MTKKEAKSCIGTIEMLQRLAYNIHGVMDVIDADNCKKIIKALEQEPCEECVSRQAVIDTIYAECSGTKLDIDFAKVLLLQRAIKALPSAIPQEPKIVPAYVTEVLDEIRADIISYEGDCRLSVDEYPSCKQCTDNVFESIYAILDKCKAEVKGEEPEK